MSASDAGAPVVVVGGGISGLTLAHRLRRIGREVLVLDAGARPGGLVRSEPRDGFLCEAGPDSLVAGAPDTEKLIEEVGLGAAVVEARPAARKRLLLLGGRLRALPGDVLSLVATDVLSPRGKWRLLREPFVAPRPANDDGGDESLLAFAERRLGPEAARNLVAPAAIGVFAGEAARLSLRSAFPRLFALEAEHGSLLRGLRALRKQRGSPLGRGRLLSFTDGLEQLPRALAAGLGSACRQGRVRALGPRPGGGWTVALDGEVVPASAVVLACPPPDAAALLAPLAPRASAALQAIPLAPVAAVCLGWRRAPGGIDPAAYGFLVARGEATAALGCQYQSNLFAGRAPAGGALVRVLLGGVFDPGVTTADEPTLVTQASSALHTAAGIQTPPDFTAVFRTGQAIPQYQLGHQDRVAAARAALSSLPGLHLLGYGLDGIGLNDCIRNATRLAALLT